MHDMLINMANDDILAINLNTEFSMRAKNTAFVVTNIGNVANNPDLKMRLYLM